MSDVTEKNHFKSIVQVTIEVTHQFDGGRQAEAMVLNALRFPAVTRIAVNHIDTVPVIVEKQ